MKSKINLVFWVLTLMFFLIKCTPSNPTTPGNTNTVSTLKFTANGVNYAINGSLADNSLYGSIIKKDSRSDQFGNPQFFYSLIGTLYSSRNEDSIDISIPINCCIVQNGTSSNLDDILMLLDNTHYGHMLGDNYNITISNISNGYASGTFSGNIHESTSQNNPRSLTITNGEFTNVKILN